jgi:hypothetical protein
MPRKFAKASKHWETGFFYTVEKSTWVNQAINGTFSWRDKGNPADPIHYDHRFLCFPAGLNLAMTTSPRASVLTHVYQRKRKSYFTWSHHRVYGVVNVTLVFQPSLAVSQHHMSLSLIQTTEYIFPPGFVCLHIFLGKIRQLLASIY